LLEAPGDELRRFAGDLAGAKLICAGLPAPGSGQPVTLSVLQQWGYSALSHQYYRCYCARWQRSRGAGCPAPAPPGLTGTARPGRAILGAEDQERKQ
jgi:hypothetical protein